MRRVSFLVAFLYIVISCFFRLSQEVQAQGTGTGTVAPGANPTPVPQVETAPVTAISSEGIVEIVADCNTQYEREKNFVCANLTIYASEQACEDAYKANCVNAKKAAILEAQNASKTRKPYVPTNFSSLNKLGSTNITQGIAGIIQALVGVIGSIALAMFVYGGFLWMTSRGNGDQTAKAAKIMVWAALGVIVILSSYAIVDFLFSTFG